MPVAGDDRQAAALWYGVASLVRLGSSCAGSTVVAHRSGAKSSVTRMVSPKVPPSSLTVTGARTPPPSALTVRLPHSFRHPELPDRGHDKWDVLVPRAEKFLGFGPLARRSEHRTA
jgi:hypothetical protein